MKTIPLDVLCVTVLTPRTLTWIIVSLFLIGVIGSTEALALDPNVFTSLGTLNVGGGAITFDTDALTISGTGGLISNSGVAMYQGGGNPEIAVFTFDDVLIAAGVTVNVTGLKSLAILSQGSAQILTGLNISGSNGLNGQNGVNGGDGGSGGAGGKNSSVSGSGGVAGPSLAGSPGGSGGSGGPQGANGGQIGGTGSGGTAGGSGGTGGSGTPGGAGQDGANGTNGLGGPSGPGIAQGAVGGGSFVLRGGELGTQGAAGVNGNGGGGGGGGGGYNSPPDCTIFCFNGSGNGGGGGGGGAQGGGGGLGGGGGRAIEIGAVDSLTVSNGVSSTGGKGGSGGKGGVGGSGGPGNNVDTAFVGAGGKGGDGGAGGDGAGGNGGAGGTVYVHGASVSVLGPVDLGGGAGGTPGGITAGLGTAGMAGLFKLDGTMLFHIDGTDTGEFDVFQSNGNLDLTGGIKFDFLTDLVADGFEASFTIGDFFGNGIGVGIFQNIDFTATSPTRLFDVSLNQNGTFSLSDLANASVPVPAAVWLFSSGLSVLVGIARKKAA